MFQLLEKSYKNYTVCKHMIIVSLLISVKTKEKYLYDLVLI